MGRASVVFVIVLAAACESTPRLLWPSDGGAPAAGAVRISSSDEETCMVSAGAMHCWGAIGGGSLTPVPIAGATDLVEVESGAGSACALDTAGRVHCFGRNRGGELGTGDTLARDLLTLVSAPTSASLGLRWRHTCAVTLGHALYCWGEDSEDQLGRTDAEPATVPGRVDHPSLFISVSTGHGHTCAIAEDRSLWCWGRNTSGECGVGLAAGGRVRSPMRVAGDRRWLQVDAGPNITCGVATEGTAWCWGWSTYADGFPGVLSFLGDGREIVDVPAQVGTATDWRMIDPDAFHACGVRGSGELWCWGRNIEGQLGNGDWDARLEPTRSTDLLIESVSVGRFHTCVVDQERQVRCAGKNQFGELGLGDRERRAELLPIALVE